MDKNDYINRLKEVDLRPKKVKPIKPPVQTEILIESKQEILKELFVKVGEIQALPTGPERDMQILRLGMIAELDASNLYEKLAELAISEDVKKVLLSVSQEEKVHVGEFQALLDEIDPQYADATDEGEGEVEDLT